MENTISMQDLRHLNLFRSITKISTRLCFEYNNMIFFCVPKQFVSKAIGENGKNSRQLSQILNRKIKIIPAPNGIEGSTSFIESIVSPIDIKGTDVSGDELIINVGSKNKAALIGREKRRLLEMRKIVRDFFGKDVRIV